LSGSLVVRAGSEWDWTNPYFCESEECGRDTESEHFYIRANDLDNPQSAQWISSDSPHGTICAAPSIAEIKGLIPKIANLAPPRAPLVNNSTRCCMDSGTGGY
jgi:hypothetical protein